MDGRKQYTQVLSVETRRPSLRAEIEAWDIEDASMLVKGKPIGFTPRPIAPLPETVLHALADGWELLGPPVETSARWKIRIYDWWLTRKIWK